MKRYSKQRVVVGLSGGVDSAVTAFLLKQQGFDVVALFMKNWEDDDRPAGSGDDDSGYCTANIDFVDAAAVADVLGIEIEHVNFAAEYKDRVFAEFLREYQAGRTPNPDVLCNAEIKFKAFLDHALRLGADHIATGHYARVRPVRAHPGAMPGSRDESHATACNGARDGSVAYQLLKGLDPAKDQSYFLHRLNQAQLSKTLFPLGELKKTEVRRIAAEIGLPNAKKKDSTGICFIGERPFREFLNRYLEHEPGAIEDERGRRVGSHVGLSFYTLGQRQGLGIGGLSLAPKTSGTRSAPRGGASALGRPGDGRAPKTPGTRSAPLGHEGALSVPGGASALRQPGGGPAAPTPVGYHAPWFVARKDLQRNVLVVVQGHGHPALLSSALHADDASWVAGAAPAAGRFAAKTRYRQADAPCAFEPADADADGRHGAFGLHFEAPQWAVTPGQSAVLYDGEVCLGGGVIDSSDLTPAAVAPGAARSPARFPD